ncbi:MAG: TolC family protein [Bacteroidales bacterium]|jgi:outer membrane protein TolC|nr:TolC family protein [Bacteroidales bacterium]
MSFRKIKLKFSVIAIALVFSSQIQAQKDSIHLVLTLDEVISIARDQSPMATMARHQFRGSYWEYRTYKAGFLPSLSLNSTLPDFNRSIERNIQDDGTEVFVPTHRMNTSVSAQVSQSVGFTGGNIFMNSSLQRIDNLGDNANKTYLSYPFNVGFTQPINGYNRFKWQRKIEPAKYEEAKKDLIHTLEQVNNRAVGYFFDLILSQINLEIANKNYANNDTLYHIAEGRYQLGTIAENELLQMELGWLNAGAALNSAGIDLEVKKFRLRSFLGYNEMADIKLVVPKEIPAVEIDLGMALQEANTNNPDVLSWKRQLLQAEQNVAFAKSERGIQADLFAQYGLSKNAADLGGVYVDPADQQRLRIGFEIPILDWGLAKGKFKMAQSAQEVTKTNVIQSQTDFEQQVFLQVMQFNLQDDQLLIATKADTIADKRFEVTKQRFLIGRIDVLDLNVALEEKDVAKRRYVQALRNYWDYYYSLRILTLYDWRNGTRLDEDFNDVLLK